MAANLTTHEAELLALIAAGRTTTEIAQTVYQSERTVKEHLTAIFRKLGARNRAHAVALAIRHGHIRVH